MALIGKLDNTKLKNVLGELNHWCENHSEFVNMIFSEQVTLEEKVTKLFWCVKISLEGQEKVIEGYNELYDYISNLNFQDEIDNKIDELIQDGTIVDAILSAINTGYYKKVINVLNPPEPDDKPLVNDWESSDKFTDNSPLFQALIDKYGKGVLYLFPDGIYGFRSEIIIPHGFINIQGTNYNYCRIRLESTSLTNFITIGNDEEATPLVQIKNIGFIDSYGYASNNCLYIKNPRTIKIENVLFQDFYNDINISAVNASSGQTSIIEWCTHSVSVRQGINRFVMFTNTSSTIFPNGFYISNNHGEFGGTGYFVYGHACDIWVTNNNVNGCKYGVYLIAANEGIGGDVNVINNAITSLTGHAVYLSKLNRGIIITGNFIEEDPSNTRVFAAIRLNDCNGIIISNNSVGTERTAISLHHNIGFILLEGTSVDEMEVCGNICYLGAYVVSSSTKCEFIKIVDNIFRHIGDNSNFANAFYINNFTKSLINDNVIDFDVVNSIYDLQYVYCKDNLYRGTINNPFTAENNYLYS